MSIKMAMLFAGGVSATLLVAFGLNNRIGWAVAGFVGVLGAVVAGATAVATAQRLHKLRRELSRLADSITDESPTAAAAPAPATTVADDPSVDRLRTALQTVLRRQDTALRSSIRYHDELADVFEAMREGVIVLDTGHNLKRANAGAYRLFAGGPSTEGSAPPPQLWAPRDGSTAPSVIEVFRNTDLEDFCRTAGSMHTAIEREMTLFAPPVRVLNLHSTPLYGDTGRRSGTLVVITDVSRIHRLESIRRDFVANVSHELRTPITTIQGFIETILDEPDLPVATQTQFLGIALNHAVRLNAILEDLLALSRLDQADDRIATERCEVSDVMAAVVKACLPRAQAKSIGIEVTAEGAPVAVFNAHLIEQAVINLVDNAVKYSAEHSHLTVDARIVGPHLEISVLDQGIGIPQKDLPRIFERFYRVDRARSRAVGGTGLGLAIVKHIARVHGGEVRVQSRLGVGSTFTMILPLQPAVPQRAPTPEASESA